MTGDPKNTQKPDPRKDGDPRRDPKSGRLPEQDEPGYNADPRPAQGDNKGGGEEPKPFGGTRP